MSKVGSSARFGTPKAPSRRGSLPRWPHGAENLEGGVQGSVQVSGLELVLSSGRGDRSFQGVKVTRFAA